MTNEAYSLGAAQRVIGNVLIPEARAQQSGIPPIEESLPIALELFYTAYAMKPAYRRAGMIVAERYALRMGLDARQVGEFAYGKLLHAIESEDV